MRLQLKKEGVQLVGMHCEFEHGKEAVTKLSGTVCAKHQDKVEERKSSAICVSHKG